MGLDKKSLRDIMYENTNYSPVSGGGLTPEQEQDIANAKQTSEEALVEVNKNKDQIGILQKKTDGWVSVKEYGAKGDGVTDDTTSIQNTINNAKAKGLDVVFPYGIYLISNTITFDGVNLRGTSQSGFSAPAQLNGVYIKCATKTFTAFKQNSNSLAHTTYNIDGFVFTNALVGLEMTYSLNCNISNLFFDGCDTGLQCGLSTVLGGIFNTFTNIYTRNNVKGLEINGKDWANNNVFINCYFDGVDYAASMDCNGGIGAVNNTFVACEFKSSTGYGIDMKNTRNANFNNCYFEAEAGAVNFTGYSLNANFNNCVYGSLKNTNTHGSVAMITVSYTGGSWVVNGGYVYLPAGADTDNLRFFKCNTPSTYANLRVVNEPKVDGSPVGYKFLADLYNYRDVSATTIDVAGNSTSKVNVRLSDETDGFEIKRNRSYGGTGFGSQLKQFGTTMMTFRENASAVEFQKPITPIAMTAATAVNGSLFVDSSDNKLKFKDSTGTVQLLY